MGICANIFEHAYRNTCPVATAVSPVIYLPWRIAKRFYLSPWLHAAPIQSILHTAAKVPFPTHMEFLGSWLPTR